MDGRLKNALGRVPVLSGRSGRLVCLSTGRSPLSAPDGSMVNICSCRSRTAAVCVRQQPLRGGKPPLPPLEADDCYLLLYGRFRCHVRRAAGAEKGEPRNKRKGAVTCRRCGTVHGR